MYREVRNAFVGSHVLCTILIRRRVSRNHQSHVLVVLSQSRRQMFLQERPNRTTPPPLILFYDVPIQGLDVRRDEFRIVTRVLVFVHQVKGCPENDRYVHPSVIKQFSPMCVRAALQYGQRRPLVGGPGFLVVGVNVRQRGNWPRPRTILDVRAVVEIN